MNISELLITLHINTLYSLKLVAKKHKLSIQQLLCVYSIPIDGITQTSLANYLSIDVSTLSRNLNKLEIQKIIYKKSIKNDERFLKIFLTNSGKKIFQGILYDLTTYIETLNVDTDTNETQKIIDNLLNLNWYILKNKNHNV